MNVSLVRRALIAAAVACACAGASFAASVSSSAASAGNPSALQGALASLVQRARPATLGVAVLDLASGASAGVNADQAFPMMSVFKAPVAAAVLSRVDDGSLSLQQAVTITRGQVQDGSAVPSVGAHFHGERMTFTVEQLLKAAVSESDNTAVNALIRTVGGPQAVTHYLRAHGIDGMRVDMDEVGVSHVFNGLGDGGSMPAHESDAAADQRLARGYAAFLADPRNSSTPTAAIDFLRKLVGGQLLSAHSTQRLLELMTAQTTPNRLRAGVPAGVRFADKTGTSATFNGATGAYNDIGIMFLPDNHVVLVAVFLRDSRGSNQDRDALFADVARTVAAAVHR